jgi:polyhydroxyalkanoate synthase
VNPPGNPKASFFTGVGPPPPEANEWLEQAEKHTGSWWDHWTAWLGTRSGERVAAPKRLGSEAHPPLDPAPGRYVHLT